MKRYNISEISKITEAYSSVVHSENVIDSIISFIDGKNDGNDFVNIDSTVIAKIYNFIKNSCYNSNELPSIGESGFKVGSYREYEWFGENGISIAKNSSRPIWNDVNSLRYDNRGCYSMEKNNCVGIENVELSLNDVFEHTISSIFQIMLHEIVHTYDVYSYPEHYVDAFNRCEKYNAHGNWFVESFKSKYSKFGLFDACSDTYKGKLRTSRKAKREYRTWNGSEWLKNEYIAIIDFNGKRSNESKVMRVRIRNAIDLKCFIDKIKENMLSSKDTATLSLYNGIYVSALANIDYSFEYGVFYDKSIDYSDLIISDEDAYDDLNSSAAKLTEKTFVIESIDIENSIKKESDKDKINMFKYVDSHYKNNRSDIFIIV